MATKVDPSSSMEPRQVKSTVSASSGSSPKVSIFGAKAGFVIPKNKLAGSLVIRGSTKNETASTLKEENTKHIQRKTRWGPDLTLDPGVRKARALAYQTRVEQITKQLKSGTLEIGENEGLLSPAKASNSDDAAHQTVNEPGMLALLQLEKQEVIGEILHLNPGYKAPADYKPLLKETKIPLLTKAHPGYNIIGVLLGPENNTQKRLQEETGAKIRVYGTKKANGEKSEIRPPDINEAQVAYEDLYINVSADTYDKIDAAVALIELLLTPVSVNSTATSATTVVSVAVTSGVTNPAAVQHVQSSTVQSGLLPYQPHITPWFSIPQANVPSGPSSGRMPSPSPNNSFQLQPPVRSFYMPSYTGQPAHSNIMPRTSVPVPGAQSLMPPLMQQLRPQYNVNPSTVPPFGRPPMVVSPQPMPPSPAGPGRPFQAMTAAGGWSATSLVIAQSQRSPQTTPTFMPVRPPISVSPVAATPVPQAALLSVPCQSNMPTSFGSQHPPLANFGPAATFPSRCPAGPQTFPLVSLQGPSSVSALSSSPAGASSQPPHPLSMQVHPPLLTSAPIVGQPSPFPQAGLTPQMPPLSQPTAALSCPPAGVGLPTPRSVPGFSTSVPTATSSTQVSTAVLRPPHPVSGNFTFRPMGSLSPAQDLPPPASPLEIQANIPLGLPQALSFRPANQSAGVPVQGFQRSPDAKPMGQPRMPAPPPHLSGPFLQNAAIFQPPTGVQAFPPTVQPCVPIFSSPMPQNPSNSLPGRPFHLLPLQQQNLFPNTNRPPSHVAGNGPFVDSPRGANLIYDPFAPTAAPRGQSVDISTAKNADADPEYEDLMASVGVK